MFYKGSCKPHTPTHTHPHPAKKRSHSPTPTHTQPKKGHTHLHPDRKGHTQGHTHPHIIEIKNVRCLTHNNICRCLHFSKRLTSSSFSIEYF